MLTPVVSTHVNEKINPLDSNVKTPVIDKVVSLTSVIQGGQDYTKITMCRKLMESLGLSNGDRIAIRYDNCNITLVKNKRGWKITQRSIVLYSSKVGFKNIEKEYGTKTIKLPGIIDGDSIQFKVPGNLIGVQVFPRGNLFPSRVCSTKSSKNIGTRPEKIATKPCSSHIVTEVASSSEKLGPENNRSYHLSKLISEIEALKSSALKLSEKYSGLEIEVSAVFHGLDI